MGQWAIEEPPHDFVVELFEFERSFKQQFSGSGPDGFASTHIDGQRPAGFFSFAQLGESIVSVLFVLLPSPLHIAEILLTFGIEPLLEFKTFGFADSFEGPVRVTRAAEQSLDSPHLDHFA